ncbi:MAG TPA: hypothetical protein VJH03_13485 [Blastocatellia bacterium]|nr:hypothetical protein [Blastocatellia bacterium]
MPSIRRSAEEPPSAAVSPRPRLLGFLPLVFFLAHSVYYWKNGGLGNLLWMCNVANLMLAAGLMLGWRWLIRLSVIWLVPGLPLWLYYVAFTGGWLLTSFFTHVGGLIVGLAALSAVRASEWTWLHGFAWYVILQQVSRVATAPELNVNVAHSVYQGWENAFGAYWQYWLATTALTAVGLWILGWILLKLFPPGGEKAAGPNA